MGKPVIVAFATDEAWRQHLGFEATAEIQAILIALNDNEHQGTIDSDLWRGSYLRLRTLNSLAMAALTSPQGADSQDLANALYGPEGWVVAS